MLDMTQTGCCALTQIRARNNTTLTQLSSAVLKARRGGLRAAFVIQRPDEQALGATLAKAGFFQAAQFGRQRCQGTGKLTMWLKQW